ncbi:MAG: hypothetical protein JXA89_00060 [Anaerolineae bacterium]|nr:hypothetical protein [Anaerolineae bacterium]
MKIERYSFGQITIDGRTYTRDVIMLPDRVWDGWWRKEGHNLSVADLDTALQAEPDILVVGTGAFNLMKVPASTRAELEKRHIDLHITNTSKAVRLYNDLAVGDRRIAAALHLSC